MELVITSRQDIDRALGLTGWLHRPAVRAVAIQLPDVDPAQRTQRAELIRRLFNDCGCAAGTVAFTATAALVLLVAGIGWAPFGLAAGAGLVAAVAGKLGGLAWSRHRLRTELRRLGASWSIS